MNNSRSGCVYSSFLADTQSRAWMEDEPEFNREYIYHRAHVQYYLYARIDLGTSAASSKVTIYYFVILSDNL